MEFLNEEFTQRKWSLYENNDNELVYKRNELEFFIIKKTQDDKISVSFPIKNSNFNYVTQLSNYTEMYDYVLDKLNYI
jgi:hypothetical protein